MPYKINYENQGHHYSFSVPDRINIPSNGLSNRPRFHQIDVFFSNHLRNTLSKLLQENFLLREEFKKSKLHHFTIKEINPAQDEQGRISYRIYLKGLASPFIIPSSNNKTVKFGSYQAIHQAFANHFPDPALAATEAGIDAVKNKFRNYFREIAFSLDREKGVLGKYHKVQGLGTESPSDLAKKLDVLKRKHFITLLGSNHFDSFFEALKAILLKLRAEDVTSIAEEKLTANAQEFVALFEILNRAGFYNVNGKPINFWSGPEAKAKADTNLTSLSDSNVPAVALMIHLGSLLQASCPELATMLSGGSSAVFASQAQGEITIYNSSSLNAREGLVLTVGNYHWNMERPLIQRKINAKVITSVLYCFYDRAAKKWKEPITYKSEDLEKNLYLSRRTSYSASGDNEAKELNSPSNLIKRALRDQHASIFDGNTNVDPLTLEPRPRPSIRLDKFKGMAKKWKNYKADQATTKMSFTQLTALFFPLPKIAEGVELDIAKARRYTDQISSPTNASK